MKHSKALIGLVAILSIVSLGACKSSGMAVTDKGQVIAISIDSPVDLTDNATHEMVVNVANRGLNKINNVVFDVEVPNELIVESHVAGRGINMTESRTPAGTRMFHFMAGNIEVGTSSEARFHVRSAFGSLDRSGDVRVTAWSEDLPNDKLVETKYVKLRR